MSGRWREAAAIGRLSSGGPAGSRHQPTRVRPRAILDAVDRLVVSPSGPLSGSVRAGGAKNSVLKLMAACLLAEGRHVLTNVPRISDVDIMAELLEAMGATVVRGERPDQLVVTTPAEVTPEAPYELVEKMRASVVVLGPLLARCGWARVSTG